MNLNEVTIDAFEDEGFYIKSHPDKNSNEDGSPKDYYLTLGDTENFIQMGGNGKFTIQTNDKFVVNAWDNETGGLYINSQPIKDDEPYYWAVGNPSNNSYIAYQKDGTLIMKVSNLFIGNVNIEDYVEGKIPTNEDILEMLDNKVEGIYSITEGNETNYFISVSYLQVLNGKDILFLADGTKETGQVQIAGWDVTPNAFTSKKGMTMGIDGIFCEPVANENLQHYITLQYGIHNGVNNTEVTDANALTANIKDYGTSDAWYNYTYRILSNNSFTVNLISTITTSLVEFYIVTENQLPSKSSSTMKYTFCKKAVSSITVPKGQENKYLIVNYMYGVDSILQPSSSTASFELTPDKGLKAVGANISGNITANYLEANSGYISGWEINKGGLVYYANGSDNVVAGLLLPGNEIIAGKSSIGGAPNDFYNWGIVLGTKFAVDYEKGLFVNSGRIGGWSITDNTLSANGIILTATTSSSGDTIKVINVNDGVFYIQKNGAIYATSGYVGGWSLNQLTFTPDGDSSSGGGGAIPMATSTTTAIGGLSSQVSIGTITSTELFPWLTGTAVSIQSATQNCWITPVGIVFKYNVVYLSNTVSTNVQNVVNNVSGLYTWGSILGALQNQLGLKPLIIGDYFPELGNSSGGGGGSSGGGGILM